MTPVEWVSFSSLDQFLKCERQWFLQRIERRPRGRSMYLSIGTLYHTVFEEMVRHNIQEGSALNDLVDQSWVEATKKGDWCCPTSKESLCQEIFVNALRVWREVLLPMGPEAVFQVEMSPSRIARIDLLCNLTPTINMGEVVGVEPGPCIFDYKVKFSTWNRRDAEDVESSAQLAQYCLLMDVKAAFFVEVPRSTKASVNILGKAFTEEELAKWASYFTSQARAIKTRPRTDKAAFRLANPGHKLCCEKFCDYWNICEGGGLTPATKEV